MSTIENGDTVPVPVTRETPMVTAPAYTLGQLVAYFLRLGALGFGGPVALVGYMHRDLVERRRWISESDYKEGMTLAQLSGRCDCRGVYRARATHALLRRLDA